MREETACFPVKVVVASMGCGLMDRKLKLKKLKSMQDRAVHPWASRELQVAARVLSALGSPPTAGCAERSARLHGPGLCGVHYHMLGLGLWLRGDPDLGAYGWEAEEQVLTKLCVVMARVCWGCCPHILCSSRPRVPWQEGLSLAVQCLCLQELRG